MMTSHPERSEGSGPTPGASQIPRCARNDDSRSSASRSTAGEPDARVRAQRVLVTGGGGFLGRAIVERLLTRGDRVRSFSRGHYPELAEMGVETLRGDLADADALKAACRDCEVVFHAAARAGIWGRYKDYYESNVRHCSVPGPGRCAARLHEFSKCRLRRRRHGEPRRVGPLSAALSLTLQ